MELSATNLALVYNPLLLTSFGENVVLAYCNMHIFMKHKQNKTI